MKETVYQLDLPVPIALLSDLHNRPFQKIIDSLEKKKPQIIAITGDIIYGSQPEDEAPVVKKQENVLPFLSACSALAPTFLSLGNHEWPLCEEDLSLIHDTGVILLNNTWTEWNGILIGGLTSAYVKEYRAYVERLRVSEKTSARYPGRDWMEVTEKNSRHVPDISWLRDFGAACGYHILLSHHPEYFPLIPREVELILSGHAHGGQIRLFNHGLFAPGQGWWPAWTGGVVEGRMVISRGLANTAPVPRLFNPVEIVYLR